MAISGEIFENRSVNCKLYATASKKFIRQYWFSAINSHGVGQVDWSYGSVYIFTLGNFKKYLTTVRNGVSSVSNRCLKLYQFFIS